MKENFILKKATNIEVKTLNSTYRFDTEKEAEEFISFFDGVDTPNEILKKEIEWQLNLETNQAFIKTARNKLNDLKHFVIKNYATFEPMNLKLYKAFQYEGSEDYGKNYPLLNEKYEAGVGGEFYNFCEDYYNQFLDEVNEFKPFYILRTSSFTLANPTHGYPYLYNIVSDVLDEKFGCWGEAQDLFYEFLSIPKKRNRAFTEEEKEQDVLSEITVDKIYEYFNEKDECFPIAVLKELFLALKAFDETTETETEINHLIEVYNLIKSYKDNQVEAFKDWLNFAEEQLMEKEEEEKKKQQEIDNAVNKLKSVYPKFSETSLEEFQLLSVDTLNELIVAIES